MYGDSVAMRRRVGQLREQGRDIRAAADRLVARNEAVPWSGRAADASASGSRSAPPTYALPPRPTTRPPTPWNVTSPRSTG
jgi:hypothetical protein